MGRLRRRGVEFPSADHEQQRQQQQLPAARRYTSMRRRLYAAMEDSYNKKGLILGEDLC
jgi:hypothetical protein